MEGKADGKGKSRGGKRGGKGKRQSQDGDGLGQGAPLGADLLGSTAPPEWGETTTVMMRNIPNKYTQRMLLTEVNEAGFLGTFDFLYLPIDTETNANKGYCFMNFVSPQSAWLFKMTYEGRSMNNFNSNKVVSVAPATLQGFEANYAHYASARVNRGDPSARPLFLREPSRDVAETWSEGRGGGRKGGRRGGRGGGIPNQASDGMGGMGTMGMWDGGASYFMMGGSTMQVPYPMGGQGPQSALQEPEADDDDNAGCDDSAPQHRFCPQCGGRIQPAFQFCPQCGFDLACLSNT